jgi:hypothetical protein
MVKWYITVHQTNQIDHETFTHSMWLNKKTLNGAKKIGENHAYLGLFQNCWNKFLKKCVFNGAIPKLFVQLTVDFSSC